MCRSIGRICTQKGPDGAFDSSLAVYDFLYLNVFFCNFFCIYRCLVQGHTTALGPSWLLKQAAQPWGRSCKELWKNTLIDWSRQVKLLDALRTMTKKFFIIQNPEGCLFFLIASHGSLAKYARKICRCFYLMSYFREF